MEHHRMVMDVKEDVKCVILPCSKYLFLLSKHSGIRAIEKKRSVLHFSVRIMELL